MFFFTNYHWLAWFAVVNSGFYCSLLEVKDKSRSTTSVTKLLQELEVKRGVSLVSLKFPSQSTSADELQCGWIIAKVQNLFWRARKRRRLSKWNSDSLHALIPCLSSLQVLVFPLSDNGFLFFLPSSQMAPPTGEIRRSIFTAKRCTVRLLSSNHWQPVTWERIALLA